MTAPRMETAVDPTRPIQVYPAGASHSAVIHGNYGFVVTCGRRYEHLSLSWASALPTIVIATLVDATDGGAALWYIHRDLLHAGGKRGVTKVDHAGMTTFVEVVTATGVAWVGVNREWIRAFVAATDRATPML